MINIAELEKKFNSLNKFNLVFASFSFSLMTLCVKNIDKRIPIYELVFFRSLISLIITLFIINLKKINPLGKNRPLLILRGVLGMGSFIMTASLFSSPIIGIIIGLIVAISVKKSLKKIDLSEIYEWFKENVKKYGSIIIETTGIEKLSNKIKNLV